MAPRERWTANDIPDLSGKVAIVTGANQGIGYETALEFARHGAQTILACRSPERGERALAEIRRQAPSASVELMTLDLTSLASIQQFADAFGERYPQLDVLANNAGIMAVPYGRTGDGFERQVGTNHLGHFALTGRLLDALLRTPASRVVTVSSLGHRRGQIDFDNLQYEQGGYSPAGAYFRTKLLNLLFTYELQRRLERAGADALSLAAHPGFSATDLSGDFARRMRLGWGLRIFNMFIQSAAMGALPTLRAAVDPKARGGQYFGPGGFMEQRGHPVLVASSAASRDEAVAQRAWEASEELTGVRFAQLDS